MMRQYLGVKAEHPGAIVLFRMGDFFETFYDDAKICSDLLDLTLTARSKEKDPVPMAGVPHHAVDSYIARLIDLGKTVVLVDQVEDPRKAKGLVKREVTRVVSPGTFVDPNAPPRFATYLTAIVFGKKNSWGLSALDIATGEFRATHGEDADLLIDELARLETRELLVPETHQNDPLIDRLKSEVRRLTITFLPQEDRLAIQALDARLGAEEVAAVAKILPKEALIAAGAALSFGERTQLAAASFERAAGGSFGHIAELRPYLPGDALILDQEARAHLELFRSAGEGGRKGSLIGAIDEAVTAMGGRLLLRWLARPLLDPDEIAERQDAIEALVSSPSALDPLREALRAVHDLERLLGRVVMGRSTPRDLAALRASLEKAPAVLQAAVDAENTARSQRQTSLVETKKGPRGRLGALASVDPCAAVQDLIARTLVDSPPGELGEAQVFRDGVDAELDRLIGLSKSGKDVLAEIEKREKERTGIGSLKVRYNRVFGYFIEVTKANLRSVPKDYIRKQTTAGGERFYTEELKKHEDQILHADERRLARERELFQRLVSEVASHVRALRALAAAMAEIDVLAGLAHVAERRGWKRPRVDAEDRIEIVEGRHPVLELLSAELGEPFVPNDLSIGGAQRLLIITGPNMAGKSTIMRQTALITILAQMGSFVPVKEARIGVVDRVFTRVGASDDLSKGRSTFMVEMFETARILRSANKRSLILLDEIGRGTSTFDGLSIAWAVAEHLHDQIGAKTLFATHYHELTEITREKPGAVNLHVAVKEWSDKIIFLRKLVAGPTNRSYGVQVARLAGLPKQVVDRARAVLDGLEAQDLRAGSKSTKQLSLFAAPKKQDDAAAQEILTELRDLALEELSPRAALEKLFSWKDRLR